MTRVNLLAGVDLQLRLASPGGFWMTPAQLARYKAASRAVPGPVLIPGIPVYCCAGCCNYFGDVDQGALASTVFCPACYAPAVPPAPRFEYLWSGEFLPPPAPCAGCGSRRDCRCALRLGLVSA